jgi:hypothetical protein
MDNGENSFCPPHGRGHGHPRLQHQPAATPTPDRGSIAEARRTRRQHMHPSNSTGSFINLKTLYIY